jgi:hypothetical protein
MISPLIIILLSCVFLVVVITIVLLIKKNSESNEEEPAEVVPTDDETDVKFMSYSKVLFYLYISPDKSSIRGLLEKMTDDKYCDSLVGEFVNCRTIMDNINNHGVKIPGLSCEDIELRFATDKTKIKQEIIDECNILKISIKHYTDLLTQYLSTEWDNMSVKKRKVFSELISDFKNAMSDGTLTIKKPSDIKELEKDFKEVFAWLEGELVKRNSLSKLMNRVHDTIINDFRMSFITIDDSDDINWTGKCSARPATFWQDCNNPDDIPVKTRHGKGSACTKKWQVFRQELGCIDKTKNEVVNKVKVDEWDVLLTKVKKTSTKWVEHEEIRGKISKMIAKAISSIGVMPAIPAVIITAGIVIDRTLKRMGSSDTYLLDDMMNVISELNGK